MRKSDLLKLFAVPAAAFVIGVAEPVLADDEVTETPVETAVSIIDEAEIEAPAEAAATGSENLFGIGGEASEGMNVEEAVIDQSKTLETKYREENGEDVQILIDQVVAIYSMNTHSVCGTITQDNLPEVLQNELFDGIYYFNDGIKEIGQSLEKYFPEGYELANIGQISEQLSDTEILRQTRLYISLKQDWQEMIDIVYVDDETQEELYTFPHYVIKKGTKSLPGDFPNMQKWESKNQYWILSGEKSLTVANGKVRVPMTKVSKEDYNAKHEFLSIYNCLTGECMQFEVAKSQVAKAAAGAPADIMEKLLALVPEGYIVYNLGNGDGVTGDEWSGSFRLYVVAEKDAPKDPGKPKVAKSHLNDNEQQNVEDAADKKAATEETKDKGDGNAVVAQDGDNTAVTNFKTAEEEDTALGIPASAGVAASLSSLGLVLSRRKKHFRK